LTEKAVVDLQRRERVTTSEKRVLRAYDGLNRDNVISFEICRLSGGEDFACERKKLQDKKDIQTCRFISTLKRLNLKKK